MSEARVRRRSPALLGLGLVLTALSVLLTVRNGVMPRAGLDPSWMLAAEFAERHGLVFGRDFVFTYGPYSYLATRLFDPATFPRVLFYDAVGVVAVFWVPLANRSVSALVALALCFALPQASADGPIALSLFAVFLIVLRRPGFWALPFVAFCGPLVLAKYSYALLIGPLLVLADLHRVASRRAPILTATVVLVVLVADLAARQPLSALGALGVNTLPIVLGYGRAMQATGPLAELAVTLLLGLATLGFAAALAWGARRAPASEAAPAVDLAPAFAAAGFAWTLFMVFKMSFVRQDDHTLIFHEAAPAALALLFGFVDRPSAPQRRLAPVFWLLFLGMLGSAVYWRSAIERASESEPPSVSGYLGEVASGIGPRLAKGAGWLTGQRMAHMRRVHAQAMAQLQHRFSPAVAGTVDAAPTEVAELIASGLAYRPRPIVQSYSSYTPRLQALDRAHFEGPDAPQTLILKIQDIDLRLPTLALGPSLPVIGRRYDPAGSDDLGLVLRRRAVERPTTVQLTAPQPLAFDQWSAAPGRSGQLLMAHIVVQRSLAGRLAGFLFREPQMLISLRTAKGAIFDYRFIPDMAQLGVAISPLPTNWDDLGALFDAQGQAHAAPVTAIRLWTRGRNWAFGRVTVQYEAISFPPGFAALTPAPVLAPRMAALMQSLGVNLGGGGHAGAAGGVYSGKRLGADATLCRGSFDSLLPSTGGSAAWQGVGWGWDVKAGRAFDRVVLLDEAGRVLGGGLSGQPRPDVPRAVPEVRSPASGWNAIALPGRTPQVIAYGVLADGRACELGRKALVG